MSIFDSIAERRIQQAIKDGEFDHLEGFGQPIDLTEYFSVHAEDRIAFHILKNSGVVPEEISIRKSIYQLAQEIKNSINPQEISMLERRKLELEDYLFVLHESKKAGR